MNEQILSRLNKSRENDRLFLLQHFSEINDTFKAVTEGEYKDLADMSAHSTNALIAYFDYYSKTQAHFRKRLEIKQLIESIVQIPDAIKTSANSGATGDATVTLQGQLQLDLGKVVKPMNDQLAILDGAAQGLTFNVSLPNGVVQQITNINADGIDKSNLISQDFLNNLSLEVARSKNGAMSQQTYKIIANINDQTKTLVTSFINNQGLSEKWRVFKPNDQFSPKRFRMRNAPRVPHGI